MTHSGQSCETDFRQAGYEPNTAAEITSGDPRRSFFASRCTASTSQVICRQRYVGFLLMLFYFLAVEFLPDLGMSHHLYLYRTTPAVTYSDMNGYGHFSAPLVWFKTYWAFPAVALDGSVSASALGSASGAFSSPVSAVTAERGSAFFAVVSG